MASDQVLWDAIMADDLPGLSEALKTADVNARSPNENYTPLMVAANYGRLALVSYLLDKGADYNATSDGGETALILASRPNSSDSDLVVQKLLEAGADPNKASGGGNTPLMEAAYGGDVELVRILLKAGADPHAQNQYNETALSVACMKNGTVAVVNELLKAGADLHHKDVDGLTPLDLTIKSGNSDLRFYLSELVAASHKQSAC